MAGGPSLTRWHDFDFALFRSGPPSRFCLLSCERVGPFRSLRRFSCAPFTFPHFPSHQTTNFPPTLSNSSTSPRLIRMISTQVLYLDSNQNPCYHSPCLPRQRPVKHVPRSELLPPLLPKPPQPPLPPRTHSTPRIYFPLIETRHQLGTPDTLVRPQLLLSHTLPHCFRHIGGIPHATQLEIPCSFLPLS